MDKDSFGLSDKIDKLDKGLINHNSKINKLDNMIFKVINNSFIKETNTSIVSYTSKYDINEDNIRNAALKSWNHIYEKKHLDILKYFENELQIKEDHIKKSESEQNELIINDLWIGKGNDEHKISDIYRIFKNDILKDKYIIRKLLAIIKNKSKLYGEINEIERLF